ncbi:hypothetical protein [Aquibacillus sediminis]|uniref:hypothetical protein n=1 Tax=Aquibacillus sediminis TaxID=2574734 RepID=UPI001108EE47|nr:hypothetical protein [Aquibacillus sediminis]
MRLFLFVCSLFVSLTIIFQYRYKIINAFLAVGILRKIMVAITMNMPYIRERILPSILGRSV